SITSALARVTAALPGGGEARPGQVDMAQAVGRALRSRRHLVVQAGTGTGKSLAYLVPAILSGRPVVVATATKALQDQLARRDLPQVASALGTEVTFAVLKGRSNYLCRQRMVEMEAAPAQLGIEDGEGRDAAAATPGAGLGELGRQVRRLLEWGKSTTTGDRAELEFEPRPYAWSALSVTASECPGASRCPMGEECFAEEARRRAAAADVVVVNTHLYGAHLASGSAVLPPHDVVVFDEAHELEDVVASSLGLELGAGRLRALSRAARAIVSGPGVRAAERVSDVADRLEQALEDLAGQRLNEPLPEDLAAALGASGAALAELLNTLRQVDDTEAAKARAMQALTHLVEDVQSLTKVGRDRVAWVERSDRAPVLKVAPVEVGPLLEKSLWGEVTAVLTSATIPPRLTGRVGLPPDGCDQIDVGSPFPYGENALLYCAAHLPDPRAPGYEAALHEEIAALAGAAGGRTLALFTSWRAMHSAAEALAGRLPGHLYTQADLPKPALIEAFTSDESACLLATQGFFQGVDVPGRTLSLVCIDRIPFPRPDEPLNQARRERAGAAAFSVVDLPRAATMLAQAAGRLIRSSTDRGVVAVLDPRLAKATYRWELVNALPPMRRTRHRAEAEEFLRTVTAPVPTDS
ncbi:MAG TPA: ATP-dependent DNA helicase, partial [Acidimicrobiales bacterium]|nr:ATP-dependent DNA helicase [Acidimicrobiales bacterium]